MHFARSSLSKSRRWNRRLSVVVAGLLYGMLYCAIQWLKTTYVPNLNEVSSYSMRSINFFHLATVLVGFVASRPTETTKLAARDCSAEISAMNIARREKHSRGGVSKRTFYDHLLNLTCVASPEMPRVNYVAQTSTKQNIVAGQSGVPLLLDIGVLDVTTCQPLPNVMVEVWSANAQGAYSNSFLRGAFPAASNGIAEFQTIFPGYASGAANHINLLVHQGSAMGQPTAHVGQVFFTDRWTDVVAMTAPYNTNTNSRMVNAQDPNFARANAAGYNAIVDIESIQDDWPSGMIGYITVGINPTHTV